MVYHKNSPKPRCGRHDGWTLGRQAVFLAVLLRCRSVTRAAAAAGMSRESAYRLRARDPNGEFAGAWDSALRHPPGISAATQGHTARSPVTVLPASKVTPPAPAKVTKVPSSADSRRGINLVNFTRLERARDRIAGGR